MRIKLNENLPARLKQTLAQFGHQVDTIPEEALGVPMTLQSGRQHRQKKQSLSPRTLIFPMYGNLLLGPTLVYYSSA